MKSVVGDVKRFISAAATSQEAGFVFAINQSEQEFEEPTGQNAISQECTLCLIKPHALVDGLTGKIIHDIVTAGFSIAQMKLFHLKTENAQEFLEVYKGVVPEYHLMLNQLTAGPIIAMYLLLK